MPARKAVTEKTEEKKALATTAMPDYGDYAGGGFEGTTADSYAVPFLRVLQKGSPQVDEDNSAYIDGAKPGMLINTVTGELYDGRDGVELLFCAYERRFLIWADRDSGGGGLRGVMLPEEYDAARASGEIDSDGYDSSGNKVQDNRTHYCLLVSANGEPIEPPQPVVLGLASTQIKKSRRAMQILASRGKAPTWATRMHMRTVPEQNDKGSWHGVEFQAEGWVDPKSELFASAVAFHKLIRAGGAGVNYAAAEDSSVAEEDVTF